MTRLIISFLLLLAAPLRAWSEEAKFSKMLKASVVLHEDTGLAFNDRADYVKTSKEYPHILDVFLHLENVAPIDLMWVADGNGVAVRPELLGPDGRPVPEASHMFSTLFNQMPYHLPYGSRMDWYVSGFGSPFVLKGEKSKGKSCYVLSIAGHLWLIPIRSAGAYTLRLKLYGFPWTDRPPESAKAKRQLLLELPPTKIRITR